MRKIGISIYPGKSSLQDNLDYIDTAAKYGYSKIFTCMMSVVKNGEVQKDILDKLIACNKRAAEKGMHVVADVSREMLTALNITVNDLSYFKKLYLHGIRLDYGYGGEEQAYMSYNDAGLQLELNACGNPAELVSTVGYKPNMHNLVSSHNFYPKKGSGLSKSILMERSAVFKQYGVRVGAFVTAHSASFGPWDIDDGVCSLEEHRYLPIETQAKDLFYSGLIDDVLIGNAFASEEELKRLSLVNKDVKTLDIELEYELSETERKIAFDELHTIRGDASDMFFRSPWPRVKYKDESVEPKNTRNIEVGDVLIENNLFDRYKGELQIAAVNCENTGASNVIGKISKNDLVLLNYLSPWEKFKLKKV